MARPVPAADGEDRIYPGKEPFTCLPRSIRLGGGEPGRDPASCACMGSGVRAGLSPKLHMEREAPSGRRGQPSGVQFQSPDLLGPTRPALQLLLAVAQRL